MIRPSSPNNYSSPDLFSSSEEQELKNELERVQDENAGLKQQLEIQTQVFIYVFNLIITYLLFRLMLNLKNYLLLPLELIFNID